MDNPTGNGWRTKRTRSQTPETSAGGPWSWHGNCCWRSFLSFSPPGIKKMWSLQKTSPFCHMVLHPQKTRSFIIKTRIIWVPYIYIYTHTVCGMFMYYAWSRHVLSTFRNHGLHSQRGTASCDNGPAVLCFMPAVFFTICLTILFSEWRVS